MGAIERKIKSTCIANKINKTLELLKGLGNKNED